MKHTLWLGWFLLLVIGCRWSDSAITPTANPNQVVYQAYERGFTLSMPDTTCSYIFSTTENRIIMIGGNGYQYCTPQRDVPDINALLGESTAPATSYIGTVPPLDPYTESPFYLPVITLPDGGQFYCGSRAASAGTCQVRYNEGN